MVGARSFKIGAHSIAFPLKCYKLVIEYQVLMKFGNL